MHFHKLFLFLLFVFVCDSLFAATFVVTSNADSGPGTLRQALLDAAANGTATTDYINFNLPGNTQADITITVQTQLPDVTANVIIDGTTQPGPSLGVSNAKVIITVATPARNLNAFNVSNQVGANDAVEFYGLYIEGFSPNGGGYGIAIVTSADCKLVVGAPGKGNVISGNWYAVSSYLQNAIIQSNFIGLEPDGETAFPNSSIIFSSEDYDNLLIGGNDPLDGNVIIGGYQGGIVFGGISGTPIQKTVTFKNNYFGTDYKASKSINVDYNPFIQVNDAYSTLIISGNVFSASQTAITAYNQATIVVKGNYFGTDKTQTFQLGSQGGEAITESGFINATIGGNAAIDQNVFTNYGNPLFIDNTSTTLVVKNTFYCNTFVSTQINDNNNYVRIIKLLDNEVSGDAPPGAMVQLYYSTSTCPTCNPTTWFATVTANANGVWDYTGNTTQNIMASSTVANNTVGFQPFNITQNEVTITNFDCHHPGSIELIEKRSGRFQFIWKDQNGKVVGTGQKVDKLPGGTYTLEINEGGSCPTALGQFTITNILSHVYPQTFQLDCNNPTGFFTAYPSTAPGIGVVEYFWKDDKGNVLSNTSDVKGLTAGNYSLYITDSNGCNSDTVICQVLPPTAAPVIDDSKVTVTDANCDFSDGSVTGLTISNVGNANYGWSRPDGTQLAYGQTDLKNVPAGQYYFFAEYDFNCPPVKSRTFTVNAINAVTIDDSGITMVSSTCSNSNGSIKGILAPGATTYQWFDDKSKLVGNAIDLTNVIAGNYYLVVSNASCSKQSPPYTITNTPAVDNYTSTNTVTDASCNQNNGSIAVSFDSGSAPYSYRWTSAAGAPLATNTSLTNVGPGTYQLYVTDNNGCESLYSTYTVNSIPTIQIMQGSAQITNDQCGHGVASIENISITGGVPPYTFSWLNPAQQIIGTSLNLTGIGKGVYTLQVKDATTCGTASQDFTVTSQSEIIPPPDVANLQICSPGAVLLMVNPPQPGYGYRLYDTGTSTIVKDDEPSGVFSINVTNSGGVFISQYTGDCESARTEVTITIGLSSINIPNTITPNGDGINDLWIIKGIENYPEALVQIFNRYGQKVFESRGYAQPFDGKTGASLLPSGVYYYIINLNSTCKLLSGSLTILR